MNNPAPPPPPNPWRAMVRAALMETPGLVWVFPEAAVPGPTLWQSLRAWVECLRALGIEPGQRVVLSGPPGFGWMSAALAALWLRATLVPAPPAEDPAALAEFLDARLVIGPGENMGWDAHGQPCVRGPLRTPREPATPDTRFLLRTSGTGGEARWIALTDANVLAVLDSHLPVLGLGPAHRLLSTLPWSHAFGLVLECLAALRARASLVRCATPTDAGEHVRLARQWRLDWWCAVPAMVRRLAAEPGGPAVLATLRGGIVGGAALSPAVCALLADTRLRVGYGQTEASPGIMLGEPGEFSPDLLGRPVGCAVRLGPGGAIEFSGPNASPGPRTPSAASLSAPSGGIQWIDTGDLGRREGDAYFFNGRRDDLIRLDNGRTLPARACESALRALHPGAGELMLWSPDGVRLALAFTGPPPSPATLAAALGPLAARTRLLPPVPAGDWRLTVKGETDRPALRHALSTIGQLRIENVSLGIPAIVLPKN